MAAGQPKKRLINSSVLEHCRGKKKKKLDTSDYVLNMRSQIYLEWNDSQQKVLAKAEQIGLSMKDMAQFLDSGLQRRSGLADVFCVPEEIYSLNDLKGVLSYEVWATCLSESERKLLTQFLPGGSGTEQAVQSLLSGEEHHFGNPFIKWSTLLCSGNLHPDVILQRERKTRSNKKKYYSDLESYHTGMIECLKELKERWKNCKSSDEEFWRQTAVRPEEKTKTISSERSKAIPQNTDTHNDDMTKFMSYIKVTKEQHEAVKRLQHSGDGVQWKNLSHILGDFNRFTVHPYESYQEEGKVVLREHWLQVVKKDLPIAFEAHEKRKLLRENINKHLEQEILERNLITDKVEREISKIPSTEKTGEEESRGGQADIIIQKDILSASMPSCRGHQPEHISHLNNYLEQNPKAFNKEAVTQDVQTPLDNFPVFPQVNGKVNLIVAFEAPKASNSPVREMQQAFDSTRHMKPVQAEQHLAPMIDLERDVEQESGVANDTSFLSLYGVQVQCGLLPSLLPSYPSHEHMDHLKQQGPQHSIANDNQFQNRQNFVEQTPVKEKDHLYLRQTLNKSLYQNGKYPGQELLSSANGDPAERSWFPNDHLTPYNHWPGVEPSNAMSTGNSDGSLFSVFSACRNLSSQPLQYFNTNTAIVTEANGFCPNNDGVYSYTPHGPAAIGMPSLNVQWTGYQPHQDPNLQDPVPKPFVRSWNL